VKTTSAMTYGNSSDSEYYDYTDIMFLHINRQCSQVLGFTELAAEDKKISVNQIYQSFDKIFEKNKSRDEMQIDLVVDAGVSNIAQFMWTVNGNKDITQEGCWINHYDPIAYIDNNSAVKLWDICQRLGSGPASTPKDGATDA